ncbi:hypothetical protein B0A49_02547 [Cryomyces minteri]|uniref:Ubiquitin-like domain-containing protein n=1 Tax=Cryomyces minteri TaxID=331657 RepID=A0A4U0XDW0_9PEZI|nr:hypothetical protein B0A49_02547 [Cryomyces minteri]
MASTTDQAQTVELKITGPSPELEGGISFAALPTTTTVGELKSKIREAMTSAPTVERQRLIHRGKLLASNTAMLADVLGPDALRQETTHTLHLVLRELGAPPGTPSARPDSRTAGPPTNAPTPPPIHFQALNGAAPPEALHAHNDVLRAQQGGARPPGPPPPMAPPPFRFPNDLPGGIAQQHLILLNQHMNQHALHQAQHQAHHQAAMQQHQFPPMPVPFPGQPHFPGGGQVTNNTGSAATFQQAIARNQQQRAAAGRQGVGTTSSTDGTSNAGTPPVQSTPPTPNAHSSMPVTSNSTTTQEGTGPNGMRWTVTVNQEVAVPRGHGPNQLPLPQVPNLPPLNIGFFPPPTGLPPLPGMGRSGSPANMYTQPSFAQCLQALADTLEGLEYVRTSLYALISSRELDAQQGLQLHALVLRLGDAILLSNTAQRAVSNGPLQMASSLRSLQEGVRHIGTLLDDLISSGVLNAERQEPVMNMQHRIGEMVRNLNATRASPELAAGRNVPDFVPSSHQQGIALPFAPTPSPGMTAQRTTMPSIEPTHPSTAPTVYLLNSPSGPSALLLSPSGTYASTFYSRPNALPLWLHPSLGPHNQRQVRQQPLRQAHNPQMWGRQPIDPLHEQMAAVMRDGVRVPANNNGPQPQPQAQPQPAQAVAPAPVVAANPDDIDIPALLGRALHHFWRVVRIFGFIYIFLGRGQGWRSPEALSLLAALFYLVNLGVFGQRWERIRRHFEGLLPPAEGQPAVVLAGGAGAQGAGAGANAAAAAAAGAGAEGGGGDDDDGAARAQAREPTPEEAARDTNWLRERLRSAERAVALFVGSLYPGVGERAAEAQMHAIATAVLAARAREAEAEAEEERARAGAGADDAGAPPAPAPAPSGDGDAGAASASASAGQHPADPSPTPEAAIAGEAAATRTTTAIPDPKDTAVATGVDAGLGSAAAAAGSGSGSGSGTGGAEMTHRGHVETAGAGAEREEA